MLTEDEIVEAGLGQLPDEAREYLRPYVEEVVRNFHAAGLVLEQGWQDFATAPRDGTPIDIWAVCEITGESVRRPKCYWGLMSICGGMDTTEGWIGLGHLYRKYRPTHWRLLPAPPTERKGGE